MKTIPFDIETINTFLSMKEKIGWIVGLIEVFAGFAFFLVAQTEISSNSRYTWRRPYTDYEQQVIMTKWIGLILLIVGIIFAIIFSIPSITKGIQGLINQSDSDLAYF